MDFQFTSHVGLNWDFAEHWRLGYRFQHISNADLAKPNPGLNMHLVTLSYGSEHRKAAVGLLGFDFKGSPRAAV